MEIQANTDIDSRSPLFHTGCRALSAHHLDERSSLVGGECPHSFSWLCMCKMFPCGGTLFISPVLHWWVLMSFIHFTITNSVARNILVHRVILGMYKSIWSEQVELLGQRICLNSDRRCQNAFLKGLCQFTLLKWLCENSSAYSLSNCVLSTRWIFANLIGENYL